MDKSNETTFKVGADEFRVAFGWNAAVEFETVARRTLSAALEEIAETQLSATSLRAMLWAGLRKHHAGVSLEEAGGMLDALGRREAQRIMGVAVRTFFPELAGDEGSDAPAAAPPAKGA